VEMIPGGKKKQKNDSGGKINTSKRMRVGWGLKRWQRSVRRSRGNNLQLGRKEGKSTKHMEIWEATRGSMKRKGRSIKMESRKKE